MLTGRFELCHAPSPAGNRRGRSAGDADLLVTLPPLQPDVLYVIRSGCDLIGCTTVTELSGDPHENPAKVIRVPSLGSGRLFAHLLVAPLP
jgi:hypothetical protein